MTAFALLITAVILFVVALGFLAAELFVPSHGILTAICVFFAAASVVFAYMAEPTLGILAAVLLLAASPFVFYYAIKIYPTTVVGKRILLTRAQASTVSGFDRQAAKLADLVGKRGVATTMLRPAGACEIEGQRIDCVSEAALIEYGTPVEVVRVVGLKVIVRQV